MSNAIQHILDDVEEVLSASSQAIATLSDTNDRHALLSVMLYLSDKFNIQETQLQHGYIHEETNTKH